MSLKDSFWRLVGLSWPNNWKVCINTRGCYFGIAQRAQLLKKSTCLLHLIGGKAPLAARCISEVVQYVVILTSESAFKHPGPGWSHGCCPTGGSLPCGRYLLAPLNGNKEESKCLMAFRVKHTPTRLPTSTLLHSLSSMWCPPPIIFDKPINAAWNRLTTILEPRESVERTRILTNLCKEIS